MKIGVQGEKMKLIDWRRGLALVVWCLGVLWSGTASAQALFLSTAENPVTHADGVSIVKNAYDNFLAQNAGLIDRRGAMSGTTSIASDLAAAKLVVLVTVYEPSDPARMADVSAAMMARPDLMVVAFVDGCCNQAANINPFMATVNNMRPSTWNPITAPLVGASIAAPLNTASPYQAQFAANLPSIQGAWYGNLQSIPTPYALYAGNPSPAAPAGYTNAYGFFLPQQASANGAGACLFMVSDASPFASGGATQWSALAADFTAAALNANGACKQAAVDPFAAPINPTAVPTLDVWGLLGLGASLLWLTARRRSARPRG